MPPTPQEATAIARRSALRPLAGVGVFSIFTNLLMLTGPLFMLQVYDRVLSSRSEETLVALFALVTGLYAFFGLIDYSRSRVAARVGAIVQKTVDEPIFLAFLKAKSDSPSDESADSALRGLEAVRSFFGAPVVLAFFDLPWTPVFLAAIFVFHPLLGWLSVAGGGVLVLSAVLNQVLTRQRSLRAMRDAQAGERIAKEAGRIAEYAHAQGMSQSLTNRWLDRQDDLLLGAQSANDWMGVFTAFSKTFRLFMQSAILGLGAWLTLRGQMTPGAMIAASILFGRALAPVELSLNQWPLVQRAQTGWTDITRFLQSAPCSTERLSLPKPAAHVTLHNVFVMSPARKKPILQGLNFDLQPGSVLGVLGKSGSGKSTLARTLVGLVEPIQGEVRLGGATLNQYGSERLGQLVGYLPQNVQLMSGTIAENIAQMQAVPNDRSIVDAARVANVHDVILQLPDGYDTQVGQSDNLLSGGQRQRIALARALYGDPVLLVLDEPTSALDKDGSTALNSGVKGMKAAGKSVVIMTHRPSAIAVCDQLLVLNEGRIAAFGPRNEVLRSTMKNAGVLQAVVGREATR